MEPLLRVSKLGVSFGDTEIFKDLNFEVNENETLMILGSNGSGKTVLLKALLGIIPYQGDVSWRPGVKIGYVPQRVPLNRDLPITVKDFFELKKIPRHRITEVLRQVGISDLIFQQKQLGLLSSGQFQRVLIAWALVGCPEVLLFDEPTAGIDIGGEETIHDLLRKTQAERAMTVILVTHDIATVYSKATSVLCMSHRKCWYGSPKEMLDPTVLREIYGTEVKIFRHGQ